MKFMIKTFLFLLFIFRGLVFGQSQNSVLNISLKDFNVTFDSITITPDYIMSIENKGDTTFVSLELGDSPEGQILKINNSDVKILNIYQKYETSVTIMDEGPHFDLLNWKHYFSDWQEINRIQNNTFKSVNYSEELHEKFPQIDINSFKEYVKRNVGNSWYKLITTVKSVNEYPCAVDINRIIYKITYTIEGKLKEKYLIFEIPMGC